MSRSRIRILHNWCAMPYKERSLNYVFKEIRDICEQQKMPKCIEDEAKIIYQSISECRHIKGRNKGKLIIIRGNNRQAIIAACIFDACKKKGITRSRDELAKAFDISYKDMNKGYKNYKKLTKIMKLQNKSKSAILSNSQSTTTRAEDFISRYCQMLKINKEHTEEAIDIAINIKKLNIATMHTPVSIAASSILIMAERNKLYNIDRNKLTLKFDVSEVTLSKTHKKLQTFASILINNALVDEIVIKMNEEKNKIDLPPHI